MLLHMLHKINMKMIVQKKKNVEQIRAVQLLKFQKNFFLRKNTAYGLMKFYREKIA